VKYRAILIDPGNPNAERPVQILSNSMEDVKKWAYGDLSNDPEGARGILFSAKSDDAAINVYAMEEKQIAMWTKRGKPE
jgi:hypothetical protein